MLYREVDVLLIAGLDEFLPGGVLHCFPDRRDSVVQDLAAFHGSLEQGVARNEAQSGFTAEKRLVHDV